MLYQEWLQKVDQQNNIVEHEHNTQYAKFIRE